MIFLSPDKTSEASKIQEGKMAKYYVESGSFRGIVDVADAEMAAVWAIHRVMIAPTPSNDRDHSASCEDDPSQADSDLGLFRLADEIATSERGFGSSDSELIATSHAFIRWAQLVYAMEKIASERPRS
jgi:hypothetical protein